MLPKMFERLNWQQAVVTIAFFALVWRGMELMPAELWSKIPGGAYAFFGSAAGLAIVQSLLGKIIHPSKEKARQEAERILSEPPPPPRRPKKKSSGDEENS